MHWNASLGAINNWCTCQIEIYKHLNDTEIDHNSLQTHIHTHTHTCTPISQNGIQFPPVKKKKLQQNGAAK